jgi:hypothetical protein
MLKPLFATIAATATTAFLAAPANAASLFYDIKFFSGAVQVGTGEFSYDPTDSVTFTIPLRPGEQTFTIFNDLETFKAVILGINQDLTGPARLQWWNDANFILGNFSTGRGTPPGGDVYDSWYFQDGGQQFNMTNARVLEPGALWEGDWFLISEPQIMGPPVIGSGRWEVTPRNDEAVPEPATVVGSLVGLAWLARKRLTAASTHDSEQ